MNKIKGVQILLMSIPVIMFIVANLFFPNPKCKLLDEFKTMTYSGIISKKFNDKRNHNIRTVIITTGNREIEIVLSIDKGSFFDFVNVNDSIYKKSGQSFVEIRRDTIRKLIKLDFGCDEK